MGVVEISQKYDRWYWQGAGFREKLRVAGKRNLVGEESSKIIELNLQDRGEITGAKIMEAYFPIYMKKLPAQEDSEEFVQQRLLEYPGRYDFGRHGVFVVTQEGGRLYGRLGQQRIAPFRVLNRDDFVLEDSGARFTFTRDNTGKIIGTDFRQHGLLIEAPRIK